MKRSLLLLLLSFPAFCQSYKVAVGSNITTYVFANSSGVNPLSLRSESGLSLQASKEFSLSKVFLLDLGLQYNQFNNEFIPWLSIIDVMMFNSLNEIKSYMSKYELISN